MAEARQPDLFGEEVAAPAVSGYAEVVFNRPLDHPYTYGVPEEWRALLAPGSRVLVPFGQGNKLTIGFCVGLTDQAPWTI